ncbi:MAG TPA: T9SS C-terminal target domain-containing protein, partial [Bacteroidota bacterium]|nr:T9SS C-terminal target domain-containing protein [Bacteroidota bacterium]
KIFDLLGRETATLVEGNRQAGYHREQWQASFYASGMYIYQLTYQDRDGNTRVARKTMTLLK